MSAEESSEAQKLLVGPQSDGEKEVCRTKQAVVWIKKAHSGSIQWVDNCSVDQFNYFCLLKRLKYLWQVSKYGLLFLAVFEVPATCIGTVANCASMNKQWYSSSISVLPLNVSAILSMILYVIIFCRIYLRRLSLGKCWIFHQWVLYNVVFTGLGLLGAIGFFLLGSAGPTVYLISGICRPFVFLGGTKKLRQAVKEIVNSIPSFLDVLVSLFLCVVGFTVVGMVLFKRTQEGEKDMPTWGKGMYNMWILFTTSNSPNVFIAAFNANRVSFFFFFAYLMVTLYLLGNILLAKVYDAYKSLLKDDVVRHEKHQMVGIDKAFELLANGHNHINAATWTEFFIEYCDPAIGGVQVEDPHDTHYNTWRANIVLSVFHGVNLENGISVTQFEQIMTVFMDRKTYIPRRRPPKVTGQAKTSIGLSMEMFYLKGVQIGRFTFKWDKVMDFMILLGGMFSMWEAIWFCEEKNGPMFHNPTFWILFGFSCFYTVSLTTKISSLGFERFWHRKAIQHRYDFFNVYALLIAELLYLIVWRTQLMERIIVVLSLARVLRLCVYITPLKQLFFVIQRLMPTYWQMSMMLLLVYYVFISIGKLAFGGMIYNTNPMLAHGIFEEGHYWQLNFNDFAGGWVTLFALMVVNNWYVISAGYTQVTHTLWVQSFFISFFVVVNLIVLNILMALILDCTALVADEIEAEEERAEKMGDDMGKDDLEQMAMGSGAHSAEFMLRKVLCTDEHMDNHFHEQHPDLPTPRKMGKDAEDDALLKHIKSHAAEEGEEYGTFLPQAIVAHPRRSTWEGSQSMPLARQVPSLSSLNQSLQLSGLTPTREEQPDLEEDFGTASTWSAPVPSRTEHGS